MCSPAASATKTVDYAADGDFNGEAGEYNCRASAVSTTPDDRGGTTAM
jgi:hypothetical protein